MSFIILISIRKQSFFDKREAEEERERKRAMDGLAEKVSQNVKTSTNTFHPIEFSPIFHPSRQILIN